MDATPSPFPLSQPQPTTLFSRKRSSKHAAVFCCCCPVASGVWILSLCIVIPSVALVLGLNITNLQGTIKFNTPLHAKIFYSVVYSLYAAIGLAIGLGLNRIISANRRLRILIMFYWILIVATVIEGIYFGVMIAMNKAKFITNCGSDKPLLAAPGGNPVTALVPPVGSPNNGTVAAGGGTRAGRAVNCHKTGAMIGAIYIAGPGGWIILHISWILLVALYAKALRRHHAADEEHGTVKMAPLARHGHGHGHDSARSFNKSGLPRSITKDQFEENNSKKEFPNIEPVSGFHSHQNHPFQLDNSSRRSSSGRLGSMFRNMRPWSPSSDSSTVQNPFNNTSSINNKGMHVIDEDDNNPEEDRGRTRTRRQQGRNSNTSITITITNNDKASGGRDIDGSSDEDDDENINSNNRLTRLGTSSTDGSLSSRTDIPADGKGWWIRQIEGKRRGEICPCTLDPRDSRDLGPCWCGKERRVSSGQSQSSSSAIALVATQGGSGSGSPSSTSIAPA